jgi:hypothetical protein
VTVRPSQQVAPAPRRSPEVPARAAGTPRRAGALRQRWTGLLTSSPGRLSVLMGGLLALGLLAGIVAVVGAQQRGGLVDSVRTRSGPLTVAAQQLYRSLSDADATAAAAFLSTGAEPADLRQRYEQDIASASAALAQAGVATETDTDAIAQIAQALPIYTGLVETARSYNRLNLPVGSAYLREASALMRERLLPAAKSLYQAETGRLGDDRSGAAGLPWLALGLVILTLVGLVWAQRYLSRRTRRTFNVGLLAATAGGLALLLWLGLSWIGVAGHLHSANRDGAAQVDLLSRARIAALTARGDEALTLVAHGNGKEFDDDFKSNMDALSGADGKGGLLAKARAQATDDRVAASLSRATELVTQWRAAHDKLRGLDDNGQFPDAVTIAIGSAPDSTGTLFNGVDAELAGAIGVTSRAFDAQARKAAGSLTGAGPGLGTFTLVLLIGVSAGLVQRIAEYR